VWFNNTIYGVVTSSANALARSTDGGQTWTNVPVAGSGFMIACAGSGAMDFWYARGSTIYRSTDRGVSFASSYVGTGTYVHLSFTTSGSNTWGWAVTSTGGIAAFNGTVTGVGEQPRPIREVPLQIALKQNYPNPFNPATTIDYSLPGQANVKLQVFDMLGRQITTLVNDDQPEGAYTVRWEGTDNSGAPVASGVYFYRIEAKTTDGVVLNSMKKMVLLK
jgi:hypothetical protein